MLQAIKDKTRGWIAYVIIAMLAIPFAFFGVYNYFQPSSDPTVAEVNGEAIKRSELDRAVQRQREQIKEKLGERYDAERFSEQRLRRQALEQLIEQRVLRSFADRSGMTAPDGAVAQRIRSTPAFQVDGEFSQQRYEQVLQRNNRRVGEYEDRLRQQATLAQFRDAVSSSAIVTDVALERVAAVQYQRRHLTWLRVKADALSGEVEIGDDAVASFYEDNKDGFRRPEQVKLAYIDLSQETLGQSIQIDDQALRERYEQVKDRRGDPERRRTQHILIDLPEDASGNEVDEARKRLGDLREAVRSGEISFEEAAREHSDDRLSAKNGGSIGVIEPGDLGGAFDDAVFDLEPGRVSEPVRTSSGLHLIRVTEVKPPQRPSFDSLKDELRGNLIEERVAERLAKQSSRLKNLAYENPQSLEPAADALGLEVRATDWFTRRGANEGIASRDAVVEAAFSERVLGEGRNSKVLELSNNRRVVVRVQEHKPEQVPPLEEVRGQVVERLRSQQSAELARERGQALIKQVREQDKRFGTLADGEAVELSELGLVSRQSAAKEAPRALAQTAFQMRAPGADAGLAVEGVQLRGGDYAVIGLRRVQDGSLEGLSDSQRQQLRQALRRSNQESSIGEVTAALREAADVTIYDSKL